MVLDSGLQSCSREMSSSTVHGFASRHKKVPPQKNVVPPPASDGGSGSSASRRLSGSSGAGRNVVPPPASDGGSGSSASRRLSGSSGAGRNVVPPSDGGSGSSGAGRNVVPPSDGGSGSSGAGRNVVPPSDGGSGSSGAGRNVVPPSDGGSGSSASRRLSGSSGAGRNVVPPSDGGSGSSASRRLSGCSLYMGTCSWMRRSESSVTINSTGSPGGRIRSSGSLPSISRAKKKTSCLLVALRPANVEQEREKFFLSNYTHNPHFLYEEPLPLSVLEKYSRSSDQFLPQALRILNLVISKYGNYENFESITGGKLLRKSQIWARCRRYMQKEGCSGEVVVQLTEDLLSQAVMTTENSRPTLTINLLGARQHWLEGVLRHEIGTHYLRGVNDARHPWHGSEGRKQFGLKPVNPTEEGLASLHSVLFRKHPFLWRAALLYYTVSRAATCSFSQIFQDLQQFVEDPAVRWEYCVRAKRGQGDTAHPGCFSKDQVYLDGILRILRHRRSIDFRLLTSLGKVSFEDVAGLQRFAELDNARLPHFMQDTERYHQHLLHIMETNQLDDEELQTLLPE